MAEAETVVDDVDVGGDAGGDAGGQVDIEDVAGDIGDQGGDSANDGGADDSGGERVSFLDTVDDQWRGDVVAKLGLEGEEATKMEKHLLKYGSIDAALKGGRDASVKISRGEISDGKPDPENTDAMNAWREERGIPADTEGYAEIFEKGDFNEIDKNILNGAFDVAHKYDMPLEAVDELIGSILANRQAETDKLNQEILTKDAQYDNDMGSILKETWGANTDSNMEAARQFINKLPESLRDKFTEFRDLDGKGLIHHPELWVALSDAERKINPMGTVVGTSENAFKTAKAEYDALTERMGSDPDWHKDQAANDRWEVLHDALEKSKQ